MRRSDENVARDIGRLEKALVRPCTMRYLAARFRVTRRTVFRWMDMIESNGVTVARVGLERPTKYQILAS